MGSGQSPVVSTPLKRAAGNSDTHSGLFSIHLLIFRLGRSAETGAGPQRRASELRSFGAPELQSSRALELQSSAAGKSRQPFQLERCDLISGGISVCASAAGGGGGGVQCLLPDRSLGQILHGLLIRTFMHAAKRFARCPGLPPCPSLAVKAALL